MVDRTEQTIIQDPRIVAERLRLANLAQAEAARMRSTPLPAYQAAGLSPTFTTAGQIATQGVGSYAPFLQSATSGLSQAAGALGTGTQAMMGGLETLGYFPGAQAAMPAAAQQAAAATGYGVTAADQAAAQAQQLGIGSAQMGIGTLAGTAGMYDPQMAGAFFDPFQEQVIAAQQQEMQRQADIQRQDIRGQAVAAGAFGGSREAVQQAELTRNLVDQQARLGAELRSQGFQQSQQQAQQAFEAALQRQQQAAQLTGALGQAGAGTALQAGQLGLATGQLGLSEADLMRQLGLSSGQLAGQEADIARNLGLGIGSLGTEMGQLSMSQAQLGALQSSLMGQDVQRLAALAEIEREQQQRVLDAQRMSAMQDYMRPFQELGFQADIYSGIPTSQSLIQASASPQPSTAQQVIGTGIAALSGLSGAQQSGLF